MHIPAPVPPSRSLTTHDTCRSCSNPEWQGTTTLVPQNRKRRPQEPQSTCKPRGGRERQPAGTQGEAGRGSLLGLKGRRGEAGCWDSRGGGERQPAGTERGGGEKAACWDSRGGGERQPAGTQGEAGRGSLLGLKGKAGRGSLLGLHREGPRGMRTGALRETRVGGAETPRLTHAGSGRSAFRGVLADVTPAAAWR